MIEVIVVVVIVVLPTVFAVHTVKGEVREHPDGFDRRL